MGTGRGDALLKSWRKFETCHINFSQCSYQGVWFTPEYLGREKNMEQKRVRERESERERDGECEIQKRRRWQKIAWRTQKPGG